MGNLPPLAGEAVYRTARKPWGCICANPDRAFEVKGTYVEGGSTSHLMRTLQDAEYQVDRMRSHGRGSFDRHYADITITPKPNPNYREDCLGDIQPGDLYVEYLGEAGAFESGTRYCLACGTSMWAAR